ncbi:hypothetical protein XTG29_03237 [Xanthomonas translucens pv. graminis ART-Xtg29]|nr:hypothetical protein XTG29_03237 [Xanthomonas translucens pv. graminis ART-Xtg29]SBV48011.1 hypothetical protein XTGART29_2665 [Xanthomonas translucens pv. graminis ART-Xtg29]
MENRKFVVAGSSKEEMLALSFHVDMSALESAYATKLSQVPERESYLYVECELAKKELLSEFVNQIHALLKVRIAYQVRSGAIKL